MTPGTTHPRVLIVALGRINKADTSSNGLLVRNLFGSWPESRLAQVYSSGECGTDARCSETFKLGARERQLGHIFYYLKKRAVEAGSATVQDVVKSNQKGISLREAVIGSGLYELIFRPRLSKDLVDWARAFRPDIVFAQGYSYTFASLPVKLARRLNVPLAYYPTDDWVDEIYQGARATVPLVSRLVRWQEGRVVAKLVKQASIRIAFNEFMKAEFSRRYDASFEVLMHGDDAGRFPTWDMPPVFAGGKRHIVCAGVFDADRLELLDDLEEACSLLWQRGMPASVTILAAGNSEVVRTRASTFKFISVVPSPSHEDLPKALCAADLLIILERFGNAAKGIRLSISSKAHLFMFSSRPILVYAGAQTGVARYAKECGWAAALCDRSPSKLAEAIAHLTTDAIASAALVNRAREVATSNHSLEKIQAHFELLMQNIPSSRDY